MVRMVACGLVVVSVVCAPRAWAGANDPEAAAAAPSDEDAGRTAERVLVMDLKGGPEVAGTLTETLGGLLTAEVARRESFESISGEDIRNLVALEGQKQALGCEDSSTCLAEIAGALGARFVVFGRLNQVGGQYILQMSLLDASTTQVIGRRVLKAPDERVLVDELPHAVADVLRPAFAALGTEEEKVALPDRDGGGALPTVMLGSGVAIAAAGVVAAVAASGSAAALYYLVLEQKSVSPDARYAGRYAWFGLLGVAAIGAVAVLPGAALAAASWAWE